MILDYFTKASFIVVLRKFSEGGPYFMVRLCKQTQCIIDIQRMEAPPENWPESYIQELLNRGEEILKKRRAFA